jgi:hypothetical protein
MSHQIGKGSYSHVFSAHLSDSQELVVVKAICKTSIHARKIFDKETTMLKVLLSFGLIQEFKPS